MGRFGSALKWRRILRWPWRPGFDVPANEVKDDRDPKHQEEGMMHPFGGERGEQTMSENRMPHRNEEETGERTQAQP